MSILILVLKILFGWSIASVITGLAIGKMISHNRPPHMRDDDDAACFEMLRRNN